MTKKLYLKHKLFNLLMLSGNKEACERIFLKSSKLLQKSLIKNNKEIIKIGIINSSPVVNIKQVRLKKGKKKNVKKYPFILDPGNRISLAIKFILEIIKQKAKKSSYLYINLKLEIEASSQNDSSAVTRKDNLQKDTLLNKKYAYYRWF